MQSTLAVSYSPVPDSEDGDSSLKGYNSRTQRDAVTRLHLKRLLVVNIFMLVLSTTFLGASVRLRRTSASCPQDARELLNGIYSPALEAVEYETVTFNGSFMAPSIYRGPPSPDVDIAWNKITDDITPIRISEQTFKKFGNPRSSSVRFQEGDGGGYMANLEMNHQLHCLNMLRKFSYRDYYKSDEMLDRKPSELYHHLGPDVADHCVEMIRQRLMCTSDINIITYDWVKGFDLAYPNFNTVHTCRKFNKIMSWNDAHSVRIPVDHVVRFGDEVDLPHPP